MSIGNGDWGDGDEASSYIMSNNWILFENETLIFGDLLKLRQKYLYLINTFNLHFQLRPLIFIWKYFETTDIHIAHLFKIHMNIYPASIQNSQNHISELTSSFLNTQNFAFCIRLCLLQMKVDVDGISYRPIW
jgi:hypothetical protein